MRLIPQIANWNAYLIMVTSPTYQPRHLLSAWGVSFCIHAIVLASAVAFLHDLPRLEPPVYRMEFLLTDPKSAADAATSQEATTVTEHSSPTAPSRSRATSTSSMHVIEQQPPTETSIVQPAVNPVTPAAVEQREMSPSATTSDSTPVASPTPSERHVDTLPPVIESRRPATMNTSRAVERPFMTATPQVATSPIPIAETITKSLQGDMAYPPPPASGISQNAAETAGSPSSNSASSLSSSPDEHSVSSQPTEQSSVTTSQTASQTTDASSPPSQMDSGSPAATPQRTLVMNHPAIARTIPSRPDYGWLKDLLKRRIMSLQAYPRLARMQGWEGIVVVRATIKNDGSLLDAVVTESSGYASLDEDALKLMQRACPIRLQHDLGQSHIEVLIPVHYRLE